MPIKRHEICVESCQTGYYVNIYVDNSRIVLRFCYSLLYSVQSEIIQTRRISSFSFLYIPKPKLKLIQEICVVSCQTELKDLNSNYIRSNLIRKENSSRVLKCLLRPQCRDTNILTQTRAGSCWIQW